MQKSHFYKNESNGYFLEFLQVKGSEKIIFDQGFYRGIWSKSSTGYIEKNNYYSKYGPNRMFFCSPYHHKVAYNETGELYIFSFSNELLSSPMLSNGFANSYPLFLSVDYDNSVHISEDSERDFNFLCEKLSHELTNPRKDQEEMIGLILAQYLVHYQRLLSANGDLNIPSGNYDTNELVEMFCIHVENYYKTKHKVKDYADLLDVSTVVLSNAFRNFPLSPMKLIHQRLLLEAKRLLAYSNLGIKQISYELGFQETSHFHHFFKNQMDLTPKEFQASYVRPKGTWGKFEKGHDK